MILQYRIRHYDQAMSAYDLKELLWLLMGQL